MPLGTRGHFALEGGGHFKLKNTQHVFFHFVIKASFELCIFIYIIKIKTVFYCNVFKYTKTIFYKQSYLLKIKTQIISHIKKIRSLQLENLRTYIRRVIIALSIVLRLCCRRSFGRNAYNFFIPDNYEFMLIKFFL